MLPKLKHATYTTNFISNDKPVKFRPWQAREEQILLMAKAGEDEGEILSTVQQIVQNAVLDDGFDAERQPVFELEWLFIQSRIKSVGPTTKVSYIDQSDRMQYDFTVDLTKVEVIKPEIDNKVKLDDDVVATLKWPDASAFLDPDVLKADGNKTAILLAPKMIDKIYSGDQVFDINTYTPEEVDEFIKTFPISAYQKMMEFLEAMPRLHYEITYKNAKDQDRKIVLDTLSDFFTFQ